jgi:hypothetical protein
MEIFLVLFLIEGPFNYLNKLLGDLDIELRCLDASFDSTVLDSHR